jgi:uncharacterized membrane protein
MITDTMLNNSASTLNSAHYNAYLAVTTDTSFSADADATDIGVELGSRLATDETVALNVFSASVTRSGALAATDGGDTLTGLGYFDSSSGGDLSVLVPLPSLNQTTNFDIEFNLELTVSRR